MTTLILRVNSGGQPVEWMPWQQAVLLYVKDQVVWTLGERPLRIRGGVNRRSGCRSYLEIHPVVAVRGAVHRSVFDRGPTSSPPVAAATTARATARRRRPACACTPCPTCPITPNG